MVRLGPNQENQKARNKNFLKNHYFVLGSYRVWVDE